MKFLRKGFQLFRILHYNRLVVKNWKCRK